MSSSNARPKWWQLYLSFPLLIALFIGESHLKISSGGHETLQIGILMIIYGLIHIWLKANSSALSQMDRDQYQGRITVIQISPDGMKHPTFQIPASERKGVLSDTFDVGYIEADSFPIDQVSR